MPAQIPGLLGDNPIFKLLNAEQQAQAAEIAHKRSYQKGAFLALNGDIWPYLFMVVEGQVECVKESPEGRQLVVLTLQPGDIFWGLAFFNDDAASPVTLATSEDTTVVLWSRDHLLPLLLSESTALWQLCQLMIRHMQRVSQIVEGLAFQPVAGRLANLLLDQFVDLGETSMNRNLTLDQIAAKIGTTREQTCRALYQFSDRGLIHITRTEFKLIDQDGLAEVAGKA